MRKTPYAILRIAVASFTLTIIQSMVRGGAPVRDSSFLEVQMRNPALVCGILLTCLALPAERPTQAKAEALVHAAIAYARRTSLDQLIQETNRADGRFHVGTGGELYIFIYDLDGTCRAIGFDTAAVVGKNRMTLKDADGKPYIRDFINLAKAQGHGWLDYKKASPVNNKIEPKTSYVELFEGVVIGAGVYKE